MPIQHTINGRSHEFTVTNIDADALTASIGYASMDAGGPDVSEAPSALAYPTAEIEDAVSGEVGRRVRFDDCAGCGASGDDVFEFWRFRAVD